MYLYRKTYVGNKYREENERLQLVIPKTEKPFIDRVDKIKPERISYITEEVAYWRKANQIHNWFVENIQDGIDDCGEYWLSEESLELLIEDCKEVIESLETSSVEDSEVVVGWDGDGEIKQTIKIFTDTSVAQNLLPPTQGFFFGSYEFTEYYLQDLKDTVEMLEPLLKEGGDFYYRSSW